MPPMSAKLACSTKYQFIRAEIAIMQASYLLNGDNMHFTSPKIKRELTRPIVSKWINAFEEIIGQHGHLYPVHEEPISPAQLILLCQLVRNKLNRPHSATPNMTQAKLAKKQAFSLFVQQFPELRQLPTIAIPFRDHPETDAHYADTSLLRSLDIISSVYRSRDVDPNRPLNFFEAAKILTRIFHILSGKQTRHKVFLAHASADKEIVRNVRVALQTRGIDCFFDEANLPLSSDLRITLKNQICAQDTVMVVFISRTALTSEWVNFELDCVLQEIEHKPHKLIVIRLDETPLPDRLNRLRHSDFLYCRAKLEYQRLCDLEKNVEEIYFSLMDLESKLAVQ